MFKIFSRFLLFVTTLSAVVAVSLPAAAATLVNPGSGAVGLQGTISTAPPTQAATIAEPVNGQSFSTVPVTVSGLCPTGLLVKIFSNNVFIGSTLCVNGSYSLQVDLFAQENVLVAIDYDALDQAGPDSNTVTVTYNDAQAAKFGSTVSLTSDYARRGADPGAVLDWPIILSGGSGPYAISVDWGDGSPTSLLSEAFGGVITLTHTYTTSGVYSIIIKATDTNGTEAYLQVIGVADGAIQTSSSGGGTAKNTAATTKTTVLWWPAVAMLPLLFATFWIGRRHELVALRRQLEKSRDTQS